MKVERVISVYNIADDKLVMEVSIHHIPLHELRAIVNPDKEDMEMFKVYPISRNQVSMVLTLLPELHDLKLDEVELFLECYRH